jgi:hypothetical protein
VERKTAESGARERAEREGYTTICAIVVALLSRGAYLCEAQPIFIALVLVSHRGMVSIVKKETPVFAAIGGYNDEGVVFP